jgi:hypothetical protein
MPAPTFDRLRGLDLHLARTLVQLVESRSVTQAAVAVGSRHRSCRR